ncbi:hypothetical protein BU15DRAFT_72417 [Melanogaster broomeanus]|nr:hypothetical protein BU15DRAFT_72417 [Melanogaster broomeanus]
MHSSPVLRSTICFWMTLLAIAALASASPMPEPAPIDSSLASVIASNLNLGCINGCEAAASVQQPSSNAALPRERVHSRSLELSSFAGGVLAAI